MKFKVVYINSLRFQSWYQSALQRLVLGPQLIHLNLQGCLNFTRFYTFLSTRSIQIRYFLLKLLPHHLKLLSEYNLVCVGAVFVPQHVFESLDLLLKR